MEYNFERLIGLSDQELIKFINKKFVITFKNAKKLEPYDIAKNEVRVAIFNISSSPHFFKPDGVIDGFLFKELDSDVVNSVSLINIDKMVSID